VGGGGPSVAWFPLAPGEVYVPYYRGSRGYVERINVTNTVVNVTRVTNVYDMYNSNQRNVTNITYVNQRVNNGVTVVSRETFVNARPVFRNVVRYDERQIVQAQVEPRIQVQPVRASVLGAGAPARVRPPQAILNRQVVATRRPSPPKAPFEQRREAMNVRTEPSSAQPQPLRNQGPERPVARPVSPVNPPEPAQASSVERPERPEARPQRPIATPREAQPVPRPPQASQAQDNRREQNNRAAQGWSYPQAKPAPPVQERTPAQSREDENKFRNWQQQRQQAAPPQNNRPQERPQPHPQEQRHEQNKQQQNKQEHPN
jgi:hypothetical protein